MEKSNPRVIDDDKGQVTVSLYGKELRGWSYADDAERRQKMLAAREYVEGWCDGGDAKTKRLKEQIDTRLNNVFCEMKDGYDDSIVGFIEAWDIVRGIFVDTEPPRRVQGANIAPSDDAEFGCKP
jgi:hypothetical protein